MEHLLLITKDTEALSALKADAVFNAQYEELQSVPGSWRIKYTGHMSPLPFMTGPQPTLNDIFCFWLVCAQNIDRILPQIKCAGDHPFR